MPEAIQCPLCRGRLAVAEENRGKAVRCPHCAGVLRVPGGTAPGTQSPRTAPAKKDEVIASVQKRPVPPAKVSRPVSEAPARSRAVPPRPQEDERPKGKSARPWIIAGVAGGCGVVALGAIVLVVVVSLWVGRSKSNKVAEQATPLDASVVDQPAEKRAEPLPVAELPRGPVPDRIEAAALRKAKQATVYLRVHLPNGETAEGSGFFSLAPGIVTTNAHVLGMLRADSTPPSSVEVVVHSGEPGEMKRIGTVLGVDRTNDLAVLRIQGDHANLPPPLAVDSATNLLETQKVYIFGFPLGAELGKNITVSESSVSSLRRDDSGQLHEVQVNGGMHPGNSGGPVTDARGVVVGVSATGIHGTQLKFAIPGDLVKQVLDGRCDRSELGMAYQSGGQVMLPVKMTCLDPLNRIRAVKLDLWMGAPGEARPASAQQPRQMPGDGPHTTHPALFREGVHMADVPLPKTEPGQVCWIQPVLVKASGQTVWEKAIAVPFESHAVLERKPALLQFKPPSAAIERTLKAHSALKATIYKGKESLTLSQKMEGNVLESLSPDQRGIGTFIRLTLADCPFTREAAGETLTPPRQAQALLSQYSPTFLVDAGNACKERGKRNFNIIAPLYRDTVERMYETICNTYESTTLPLPNRTVQPLESWPARMPMLVLLRGKRQIQDIHLTCNFEGVRSVAGHSEAYIGLSGVVKGRGPRAALVLGKATGHAHFDVEKGFLTLVTLTVHSELENEEAGVRILVNDESTIRREEGNRLGIAAATRNQPGGAPGPRPRPRPRSK